MDSSFKHFLKFSVTQEMAADGEDFKTPSGKAVKAKTALKHRVNSVKLNT
jgi:hypothetical protein